MSANLRRIRGEVPRAFEVVERDNKADSDPSRKRIGRAEAARRLEPLMQLVASGEIPMDRSTAEAVASYLESRKTNA